MTASDAPVPEVSTNARGADGAPTPRTDPPDPFFEYLARVFLGGDSRNEIPLTLSCSGTVVAGIAVPQETWVHLLGEEFREVLPSPVGDDVADGLRTVDADGREREVAARESGAEPAFGYVNLKDAVLVPSGTWLGLWRVRLDRLDGWTLGSIGS
ncbi:hypothetical protein [Cellulomonas shaoxiangyii]|uniref:hypothetical protein n=1 Tax=Cellulomonas shaoxiangyii TaxID=2566013 RepID=UPI00140ACB82|nr:hypothetical protein [Cellulomonas shaoxiangyii]